MKAVIMAGGQGKRISEIFPDIPKPMIPIEGVPVLEREISVLREQDITEIILTVGYKAKKIIEYFGDGNKYGVNIEYYVEEQPLGNAGALYEIKSKLTEDFLLLNADSLFNVDFQRFIEYHNRKGGKATIFTHPNSHPYDSSLIIAKDGKVTDWIMKDEEHPKFYQNRVNAGLHILSPKLLNERPNTEKVDLDKQILQPLVKSEDLYCYDSPEYVKDMGTPERYYQVSEDYKRGIIEKKNLHSKQCAIFLDRDGTINVEKGFLSNIEQFELLPKVSEAIRKINESGFLAIVITNQPVIARGEISFTGLEEIHNKMETLLGADGAYLDDIYYCPHHPDKGFKGEVKELKVNCSCRKPKPGMILSAAEKFNIDLSKSWMIGDSERDVLAGKAAGCKTILIADDTRKRYGQDYTVSNLYEGINLLIQIHNLEV
ncbi:HAD-IIIA family hydrolase [Butyrivibrio fibrisolvens]|uniref:HAD-IIIA family hydrolase n=1 Tax=Pseudobutyrivibrio ruminis TaxID=46206 RepID=UPI00040F5136|nr:HAD-IIIA family hydrolase [Pseudobutyrivibrio ruminis]MDC7279108.1 HAD-IIIA family hydrolase [Butyrivibrio fibrisolvens]